MVALEGVIKRCQDLEALDRLQNNSHQIHHQQDIRSEGSFKELQPQPQEFTPTQLPWQYSGGSQGTPVSSITNSPYHPNQQHLPVNQAHPNNLSPTSLSRPQYSSPSFQTSTRR